jgi:SAM-dependent methyltransferase
MDEARDRTGWQGLPEWQGDTGRRWAAASATADAQFGRLSDAGYRALGPIEGHRVLDVGCGSGGTTAELAGLVGPHGRVVGIDPSGDVLDHARRVCAELPVDFVLGDAQTHAFETGGFDVVFSRLGVMFFEDPQAAFANLRRATVAGGRLVFSCWPTREFVPLLLLPLRALSGLVELPPPAPPGSPNPFSLGDPTATTSLLERAGWHDVHVEEVRWTVELPDDARAAAEQWLTTIPVTLSVQDPDPATRARLLDALAAAVPASRRLEQLAYSFRAHA